MEPYMLDKSMATPWVMVLPAWPSWGLGGAQATVLTMMSQLVGWSHFILIHVPGFWVFALGQLCPASNCESTLSHMTSWQLEWQTTPTASFHPNSSIEIPSTMGLTGLGMSLLSISFTSMLFSFFKEPLLLLWISYFPTSPSSVLSEPFIQSLSLYNCS